MEAELMCGVCLEYFDKPLMLPCTHNFCRKCIEGILSVNSRPNIYGQLPRHRLKYHLDCPLCQRPIELDRGVESLTVNRILENIIALHRKDEPLASNDAAWKLDSSVSDSPCPLHNSEPMSLYCLTCNRAVCRSCDCVTDKSSGTIHKCVPIKEQADQYQMKISNAISEIKRKVVPVHDEIQLLQDMVEQIKVKPVINAHNCPNTRPMKKSLKGQHQELLRQLQNDIKSIKRPIDEQLRKHKQLSKTVEDHLKRLNGIKTAKDTGLRIKLMKESERQLNSLLCFDMVILNTIICQSRYACLGDRQRRNVQQSTRPDDISPEPSSRQSSREDDCLSRTTQSSRQSSREDDNHPQTSQSFTQSSRQSSRDDDCHPQTSQSFRQSSREDECFSNTAQSLRQSSREEESHPQTSQLFRQSSRESERHPQMSQSFRQSSREDLPKTPPISFTQSPSSMTFNEGTVTSQRSLSEQDNIQPNIVIPNIPPVSTNTSTKPTSSTYSQPSFSNVSSASFRIAPTSVSINSASNFVPIPRGVRAASEPVVPGNVVSSYKQNVITPNPVTTTSWFSSAVIPSTPSASQSKVSNVQPRTTTTSMHIPKSNVGFVVPKVTTGAEAAGYLSPGLETYDNVSKAFPVPSTADFIPQSSSVASGTNTGLPNRGLPRKPKAEYGNKNNNSVVNTATLMAMVSDEGDIGVDTIIKSMETVCRGVRDDTNIPSKTNNIPPSNNVNVRVDRRFSTGNANLPTQSNCNFRTANLPTISARDFSPVTHNRSSSPNSGARRTVRPKKKISK
ncbi:unnamed protein product [Mytilus edulis]|uniref:Uncharacterized protein n=1 Tax=Mytilus edulis TaxID=6550 RepID=A0A8S3V8I5_MYTED|nr:unnamed protein product [Mytilus edulis]